MIHDKAYNRAKDWTKAMHKYHIDRNKKTADSHFYPIYNNLHQYMKNKIHCDCWMCRSKTNPKDKSGSGPAMNWCPADQRKLDDMKLQIEELNN